MTDTAQACGNCQWWKVLDEQEVVPSGVTLGECTYPLPFWIIRFRPYASAGKDCPTWTRK